MYLKTIVNIQYVSTSFPTAALNRSMSSIIMISFVSRFQSTKVFEKKTEFVVVTCCGHLNGSPFPGR